MSRRSIAVVVLDTLRYDTFRRYFEWIPGASFGNAFSTSHWTVPAHASLLTGRYASELGVHGKSRSFDCRQPSIAEALANEGYTTRFWTANIQVHAWEGWDRGFTQVRGPGELHPLADKSVNWSEYARRTDRGKAGKYAAAIIRAFGAEERLLPSLRYGYRLVRDVSTDSGAREVLKRLEATEFASDEFLLLNLMESHTPHRPPEPFRSFDREINFTIGDAFAGSVDSPDENRIAYDDSAAYLSKQYQKIFRVLQDSFDFIITLSDHGELLGEHGMWNHGYGIYPELTHIPLVISGGELESEIKHQTVSLLDIPETVAALCELDFDSRGVNLLSENIGRDYLVEYHGFLPWHREQFQRKGIGDMYDDYDRALNGIATRSGSYVYETHDHGYRADTDGPVEDDIARLKSLADTVPKRSVETDSGKVDSDVRRHLEDLGYA